MKKREIFAKKIIVATMVATMAFSIAEGAKIVTGPARADQEDAGSFDPVYYAALYPDVAAAVGMNPEALYNHYVNFGQKEGRIPYEGATGGASVDGTADTAADTATVTTPVQATADIGNGPFWLFPYGEEVDKATFLQERQRLQQQFDAAGYVHVGWTEQQVQARLLSLKDQYPEGMKVGNCTAGAAKITNGLYGNPYDIRVGWVAQGDDDVLITVDGCIPKRSIGSRDIPAESFVRVGDEIGTRADGRGHVMIVLSRNDEGITVVESGEETGMTWGRFISWDELDHGKAGASYSNQRIYVWHYEY
jgi:hypothetical protein